MTELAGVVLAAGAGTRLRPLTHFRPKALCPVGDRPLAEHALERVRRHVGDVAVNVHHGRAQMVARFDGRVHVSVETPTVLGTAGAIGQLRGWLDGRAALVANADAWYGAGGGDLLAELVSGWDGERVRLLVVRDTDRGDFGPWRFAGVSLLPWQHARRLEAEPAGLYERCWRELHEAGALDLCPTQAAFTDCGTPSDYIAANLDTTGGDSVVGAGAVVHGKVVRSVVWPGALVRRGERLVDAIRVGTAVTVPAAPTRAGTTPR